MLAADQRKPEIREPSSGASPQRLLVVDDLEDARTSLREMLNLAMDLPVDIAADGAQALEMLCA